jgi:putative FmdB family regulatory protein
MPFYEYECSACKYYVEALRKISDPPLIKCPSCGKQTLERLLSVPVFRLKGSGWYETDFKSEKEQKRNIAGEPEAAPPEKKEGEDTSKPVARTRKKSALNAKDSGTAATSPSTKAPVKTAAVAAAKSVAKPVKKAAKKAAKKSAKKPAAKPIAKKKSAKKTGGKRKAVKKAGRAARRPKPAAKKK